MKSLRRLSLIFLILLTACAPAPTPSRPKNTPTLTTPTPPAQTPTQIPIPIVRFAVIGDYGSAGEHLASVAKLIDSWQVDFIITTGDNNYPLGEARTIDENIGQYFHEYIYPYVGNFGSGAQVNRFFPSLGNHDWYSANAQPYLDYFTLPGSERYYGFQWEFLHFFALDSHWSEPDGISQKSIQAAWLQTALSASTAPWKIVYFHHAPYSSGYHGPTEYMQWPFKDWGASVVIAGHDHHYERLMVNSLPYFVNGLGGGARYGIIRIHPGSQARYRAMHGAMLVEATPTRITFQFITVMGEVIDTYEIHK